jgi:thiamine-phosphate pyrophosphorylase
VAHALIRFSASVPRGLSSRRLARPVKRYAITEGLGAVRALTFVKRNLERAVDMIQIREKQLNNPELTSLVARALALPNPHGSKILVNSRLDIARACGAHGVHYPAHHDPIQFEDLAQGLLIGVSCHTCEEVQRAEGEGADFVVFGPVFATGEKPPIGLEALREAAHSVQIPVYALGGVTETNAAECVAAGATGVAGIRLFGSQPQDSSAYNGADDPKS